MPSLVYLDFQRILEEERADAKERFQEQLVELELHERDEQRQAQQLRERNELEQSYQVYMYTYYSDVISNMQVMCFE